MIDYLIDYSYWYCWRVTLSWGVALEHPSMSKFQQFARLGDRSKGILMSLVGVAILSPDSLLIRLAGLDDYTLIFTAACSQPAPSA